MSMCCVMVSFHTGPALHAAIKAVLADPDITELILVDNGNSATVRAAVYELIENEPRVRLVQGHGNIGFGRACNYGAQLSAADHILFLNPDTQIERGAVSALAEAGERLTEPWIAGGLLINDQGAEQRGSRRGVLTVKTLFGGFNRHAEPLPDTAVPQATISGAFFMMSRAGFNQLGGFDPAYFLHVEDIDICRRARLAGGQVYSVPNARSVHIGGTSAASSIFVNWHKYKSFLRYFWTEKGWLAKPLTVFLAIPLAGYLFLRWARQGLARQS